MGVASLPSEPCARAHARARTHAHATSIKTSLVHLCCNLYKNGIRLVCAYLSCARHARPCIHLRITVFSGSEQHAGCAVTRARDTVKQDLRPFSPGQDRVRSCVRRVCVFRPFHLASVNGRRVLPFPHDPVLGPAVGPSRAVTVSGVEYCMDDSSGGVNPPPGVFPGQISFCYPRVVPLVRPVNLEDTKMRCTSTFSARNNTYIHIPPEVYRHPPNKIKSSKSKSKT